MCARLLNSPKTLRSHKTTAMTTTPFKMDLIVACIGINRLTSHSKTPTTISTINMLINGIVPPYLAHSARLTERVSQSASHRECSVFDKSSLYSETGRRPGAILDRKLQKVPLFNKETPQALLMRRAAAFQRFLERATCETRKTPNKGFPRVPVMRICIAVPAFFRRRDQMLSEQMIWDRSPSGKASPAAPGAWPNRIRLAGGHRCGRARHPLPRHETSTSESAVHLAASRSHRPDP